MDRATQHYEAPRVTDYGSLQELTAACAFGTGGDHKFPSGTDGVTTFGKEFHTSEVQCTSK
jgi:hypothetical protein